MTVRAYKLGALGQDDLSGIKSLAATCSGSAPNYMTFEYPVGTDYQVPAGKTFYITKMDAGATVVNESPIFLIGYGNNGVADGASAPTSFVAETSKYIVQTTIATKEYDVIIPIPAEKYPCVANYYHTLSITVYGIEV